METDYSFNRNQLLALSALMFLVPLLRLFPNAAAETASRAAAFTAPAALPFIIFYLCFICSFMDRRKDGEGLAELSIRCLGEKHGRPAVIAEAFWLLLYSGFLLRCSADRLMTTIYPYGSSVFFILTMGLICCLAALGPARSIVRSAKIALPFIYGILLLILFFAVSSVSRKNLMPVTASDIPHIIKGSLAEADVLSAVIYLSCFFAAFCPRQKGTFRICSCFSVLMLLLTALLCTAVVGSFGAELCTRLAWPFFSLVRNMVFFHTLERVDALVVAVWVIPDFLLVSMLLHSAQYCIRLALGEASPQYNGEKLLSMERKRWIIPVCSAVSAGIALLIAPDPVNLELWSEKIIPVLNLAFAFVFLPAVYITGIIKKKL